MHLSLLLQLFLHQRHATCLFLQSHYMNWPKLTTRCVWLVSLSVMSLGHWCSPVYSTTWPEATGYFHIKNWSDQNLIRKEGLWQVDDAILSGTFMYPLNMQSLLMGTDHFNPVMQMGGGGGEEQQGRRANLTCRENTDDWLAVGTNHMSTACSTRQSGHTDWFVHWNTSNHRVTQHMCTHK